MLDQLLSDWDVERITRRARSTLQKDRVVGSGPPFVRIGRLVRYRQSDVQAYLDALPARRSTSEPATEPATTELATEPATSEPLTELGSTATAIRPRSATRRLKPPVAASARAPPG
jgi:hypothetical protein